MHICRRSSNRKVAGHFKHGDIVALADGRIGIINDASLEAGYYLNANFVYVDTINEQHIKIECSEIANRV